MQQNAHLSRVYLCIPDSSLSGTRVRCPSNMRQILEYSCAEDTGAAKPNLS